MRKIAVALTKGGVGKTTTADDYLALTERIRQDDGAQADP